jgi:hypothetical protein
MKNIAKKQSSGRLYIAPEIMPFVRVSRILEVVLEESQEAKRAYKHVKECYNSPNIIEAFDKVAKQIPKGKEELIKIVVKKAGYDITKPPPEKNEVETGWHLMKGALKYSHDIFNRNWFWIILSIKRFRDFKRLQAAMNDFAFISMNNLRERKIHVIGCSEKLGQAILARVMFEMFERKYKINLKLFIRTPVFKGGRRSYSVSEIMDGKVPVYDQRIIGSKMKGAGLKLHHDDPLDLGAWRWYQSRVVNSGPTEYYLKQLKKLNRFDKEVVSPENLSKQIKPYDEALGYIREKTGKLKAN